MFAEIQFLVQADAEICDGVGILDWNAIECQLRGRFSSLPVVEREDDGLCLSRIGPYLPFREEILDSVEGDLKSPDDGPRAIGGRVCRSVVGVTSGLCVVVEPQVRNEDAVQAR